MNNKTISKWAASSPLFYLLLKLTPVHVEDISSKIREVVMGIVNIVRNIAFIQSA